jgi:hypothetical protein|tara:strand:+ start:2313 stop:3137 length:825 start_codon:yes stop_codon:yes gene_type:complete
MLIRERDLEKLRKGSHEVVIEALQEAAGARPVATFPDRALFVTDDGLVSRQFVFEGEELKLEEGESVDEQVFDESEMFVLVSEAIQEAARDIINDDEVDCNRLQWIGEHIVAGEMYLYEDVIAAMHKSRGDILERYEADREGIRIAARGRILAAEEEVPKPRFAKLGDRLDGFHEELAESTEALAGLAGRLAREVGALVFEEPSARGLDLEDARTQVQVEGEEIERMLPKAAILSGSLQMVADAHDETAHRVRGLTVMAEFLKRAAEPTPTKDP